METMGKIFEIAIIGAGAAGIMCACQIDSRHSVTVFDKNTEVGRKLLLTGNGRCNLTNLVSPTEFLESVPRGAEFVQRALEAFTPKQAVEFFNSLGITTSLTRERCSSLAFVVETVVEDNNRVFPKQGKAGGVRQALEAHARSRGVVFKIGHAVTGIEQIGDGFIITANNEQYNFDKVIIATGGLSFPKTGSTGDGFKFAEKFGHKVNAPRPALCGLQFEKSTGIQGVGVHVRVTLDGNTETGDLMFTKNGVGGPVIFKLVSKYMGQSVTNKVLAIDFVPHVVNPSFDSKDKPFYAFRKYLPQSVADWLAKSRFHPRDIKSINIIIKDFDPIETAIVTRGGVCTDEINPESMESNLVPNLYFIGEVLDVDGLSGGFNLQIAWSTAVACAAVL